MLFLHMGLFLQSSAIHSVYKFKFSLLIVKLSASYLRFTGIFMVALRWFTFQLDSFSTFRVTMVRWYLILLSSCNLLPVISKSCRIHNKRYPMNSRRKFHLHTKFKINFTFSKEHGTTRKVKTY